MRFDEAVDRTRVRLRDGAPRRHLGNGPTAVSSSSSQFRGSEGHSPRRRGGRGHRQPGLRCRLRPCPGRWHIPSLRPHRRFRARQQPGTAGPLHGLRRLPEPERLGRYRRRTGDDLRDPEKQSQQRRHPRHRPVHARGWQRARGRSPARDLDHGLPRRPHLPRTAAARRRLPRVGCQLCRQGGRHVDRRQLVGDLHRRSG